MKSRVFGLRNVLTKTIAPFVVPKKKYASKSAYCDAHMNELPVPCAPWDQWYKDRQSWYNAWLAIGVAWFSISVACLVYTEAIFFNWSPPERPSDPTDAAGSGEDECEEL